MPPLGMTILIVGGGIGGLVLGMMLERANISYLILERNDNVKTIGTAIALSPSIGRALEQLGILGEIKENSLPMSGVSFRQDTGKYIGRVNFGSFEPRYGNPSYLIMRPTLYEILLSHTPHHRIQFRKRVLSVKQSEEAVEVHCADNTAFTAHILIGADGVFSAVRANMYQDMKAKGVLPREDYIDMRLDHHSVVGTTEELDPKEFPELFCSNTTEMNTVILKKEPAATWALPVIGNRISWGTTKTIVNAERDYEEAFKASRWDASAADEMLTHVRDTICVHGGTLGRLMDLTLKENIAKVTLNEKVYETWHYGRTLLIGDACHMLVPASGQGVTQAVIDAICIANMLMDLPTTNSRDIQSMFEIHTHRRKPEVKQIHQTGRVMGNLYYQRGWAGDLFRKVYFKSIGFVTNIVMDSYALSRPMLTYLPLVPSTGSVTASPEVESMLGDRRFKGRKFRANYYNYLYSDNGNSSNINSSIGANAINRVYDSDMASDFGGSTTTGFRSRQNSTTSYLTDVSQGGFGGPPRILSNGNGSNIYFHNANIKSDNIHASSSSGSSAINSNNSNNDNNTPKTSGITLTKKSKKSTSLLSGASSLMGSLGRTGSLSRKPFQVSTLGGNDKKDPGKMNHSNLHGLGSHAQVRQGSEECGTVRV